ncbi:MAG: acetyl ornithine aminotransferase family protein [Thermoplasmata archaeon]
MSAESPAAGARPKTPADPPARAAGIEISVPIPGPRAREVMARDDRYLMLGTKTSPVVAESARGVWVRDVDGNRLLDFAAGISVVNVGHCHPEVVRAIREQAGTLMHFAGTDFYYDNQTRLAEKLTSIAPGSFAKKVFFTNSGTESAEAALKLARFRRQRQIVIGLIGSFHGRTMGALSLTASKPVQRQGFNPYVTGGTHIPAPYCYRCPYKLEYPSCDLYCAKILRELYFETVIPPEDVAAFVAEPVLGEGGYIVPPKGWHAAIRSILDEWKIPLIDDEVQAGMGRTGRWFAIEHHGVVPEMITMAKALANGLPIGAVIFPKEFDFPKPGSHSNTFGGNLVAVAAALATIGVIEKERLLDNARRRGEHLIARLRELAQRHEVIGDVRGLGLMVATEFVTDRRTRAPAVALRDRVIEEALKRGLILLPCGRSSIRYIPPLVVTDEEIDTAIGIVDAAIAAARSA